MFLKKKTQKEPADPQMRILVVEDDSASRGLMQILLSEYGHCSYASNGVEAVETFTRALDEAEPFDLVCLDIMMPEMDGLEALKQIREIETSHGIEETNRVKAIMTTTASQKAKTMKAFHYGCNGYLVKPISKDAILKEMKKLPVHKGRIFDWRGR